MRSLKASKIMAFDVNVGTRHSRASSTVPTTIQDFIAFANAVPPQRRSEFMLGERNHPTSRGSLFLIHVFEWLNETPWSIHLPKLQEVSGALHILRPLSRRATPLTQPPHVRDESLEAQVIVSAWSNALFYVVEWLLAIIEVMEEPYEVRNFGYRPIPWKQPWLGETLEIGSNKKIFFKLKEDPVIDLYDNFRKALKGADAGRIRICQTKFRGDFDCGKFFWARVDRQKACSPKHAQLVRAKKWLNTPKGEEYSKRQRSKE